MMWRTHLAFGFLLGLTLQPTGLSLFHTTLYFGLVLFFSLAMDADHPESKLGQACWPLSLIARGILGHRGMLHSIWIPAGLWIGATLEGHPLLGKAAVGGMASHLLCDALTKQGIQPLRPFSRISIKGFISTGGLSETVFYWFIMLFIGIVIVLSI